MATGLAVDVVYPTGIAPQDSWSDPGDIAAGLTTRGSSKAGYTLWSFDGTEWSLTKDQSEEGYGPAAPPSVPGRFKGQVRAVLAVPV